MDRCVDIDDESITGYINVSVHSELDIAMSPDGKGLALLESPGFMRPFTPLIFSGVTPITMGATTVSGRYSQMRGKSVLPRYGDDSYYSISWFEVFITFGAGFSIPAGQLVIADDPIPDDRHILGSPRTLSYNSTADVGYNGTARLIDINNSANNRILPLVGNYQHMSIRNETGNYVTSSYPFTWAVGDKIEVTGWSVAARNSIGG